MNGAFNASIPWTVFFNAHTYVQISLKASSEIKRIFPYYTRAGFYEWRNLSRFESHHKSATFRF